MARKKPGKEADPNAMWAVRIELSNADHERFKRIAKSKGLSKSGYARMALLERIKADGG